MKLSRVLPLVGCMFTAVGILASTSPAHALAYTWSFEEQNNNAAASGSGTFDLDSTGTLITAWDGQVGGVTITSLFPANPSTSSFNSNDNVYPLTSNGVSFATANNNYTLWLHSQDPLNPAPYELDVFDSSGTTTPSSSDFGAFTTNAPSSVPFNIPGGATIPTVGSLLALGAMRKARKSIASKTRGANPVVRVS